MSPTICGRFDVLRFLARGGMGEVFLATDRRTGAAAALKTLREELMTEELHRARFEHEIRVSRLLTHPRIPRWLDDGTWNERRFLACEYVAGVSVAALLDARMPMPPPLAIAIVVDVLDALATVHALCGDDGTPMHLVHRDVAPRNLLVDASARCHLIDFGISTDKRFDPIAVVAGTPGYLAPEQRRGEPLDGGTDQYACGLLLLELLAGRSDHDVQPLLPPLSLMASPAACPGLESVWTRMSSPLREARFASCADAASALRSVAATWPTHAHVCPATLLRQFLDDAGVRPPQKSAPLFSGRAVTLSSTGDHAEVFSV